jgi:hypothetical protein
MQHSSYGLLGQHDQEQYDDFICLRKKCKERKAEKRKIRIDKKRERTVKKQLQNEERSIRNAGLKQELSIGANDAETMAVLAQQMMQRNAGNQATARNLTPPKKSGEFNKAWLLLIPVLLIGGIAIKRQTA